LGICSGRIYFNILDIIPFQIVFEAFLGNHAPEDITSTHE